jgi:hypothetical protein
MSDDLAVMHGRLKEMLKRSPSRINNAGIKATREFMEWHKKASRIANTAHPSREKLTSIFNEARQHYA